ncbi:MAG: hypothetical protein ACRCXE_02740 [Metamycoplasmataceae bacterium]
MIRQKKRERIGSEFKNNYHIWSNGRLFSLILLAITLLFFIISIVQIPFLSAIPGYTFGLTFGYYSFIFYIVFAYYATSKLFNFNIYVIKTISKIRVFNYSWMNFFLLIFGIVLIIETTTYMMDNSSPFPGMDAWTINFNNWWEDFTLANNALEPNIMNAGIITNLVLSILYSIGGTIISIIFSILLIAYFVFYLFFGSPINRFEKKINDKKELEKENKEHETKIIDLSFEDKHKIVVTDFGTKIIENISEANSEELVLKKKSKSNKKEQIKKEEVKIETVPFDNPFEDSGNFIFSEKDTQEIKLKNNRPYDDTDFVFNNEEDSKKKNKDKVEAPNTYKQTAELILENNKKNKKKKIKKEKKVNND